MERNHPPRCPRSTRPRCSPRGLGVLPCPRPALDTRALSCTANRSCRRCVVVAVAEGVRWRRSVMSREVNCLSPPLAASALCFPLCLRVAFSRPRVLCFLGRVGGCGWPWVGVGAIVCVSVGGQWIFMSVCRWVCGCMSGCMWVCVCVGVYWLVRRVCLVICVSVWNIFPLLCVYMYVPCTYV